MSENKDPHKLYFICLVNIINEAGQEFWAYVLVPSENYLEFCALREKSGQDDDFNIEEYGEIIEYGLGKDPPKKLKENLAERLQLEEGFEIKFESFADKLENFLYNA